VASLSNESPWASARRDSEWLKQRVPNKNSKENIPINWRNYIKINSAESEQRPVLYSFNSR